MRTTFAPHMKRTHLLLAAALHWSAIYAQDPPKSYCGELGQLKVGDLAPTFKVLDIHGKAVDLAEVLRTKQVVLVFYRGSWCPYCNKHLSELQENLPRIEALRGTVIAVSPEKAETVGMVEEKTGATFSVVQDAGYPILCAYGVAFELEGEMKEKVKSMGLSDDGVLPVPATYVIGMDGRIKAMHYNTDYKERMPVADVLKALGN